MLTKVQNLWTGEEREFALLPQDAVMAAYAQEHGDYDTQGYMEKYKRLVTVATVTILCGDWCAFKNPAETPEQRLAKVQAVADMLERQGGTYQVYSGTEEED